MIRENLRESSRRREIFKVLTGKYQRLSDSMGKFARRKFPGVLELIMETSKDSRTN
jgi:hypothetical protein